MQDTGYRIQDAGPACRQAGTGCKLFKGTVQSVQIVLLKLLDRLEQLELQFVLTFTVNKKNVTIIPDE
jgi:hypothetical protein